MKRIVVFILALCLCVGLCACSKSSEETSETTEEVLLTAENFYDYFIVEKSVEDFSTERCSFDMAGLCYDATANVVVSIDKRSEFEIENVSVTFEVGMHEESISSTDWTEETITIEIPVSGHQKKSVSLETNEPIIDYSMKGDISKPIAKITIKSISGSIIVKKTSEQE